MDILHQISNKAEIILSAIGVIVSTLALIQATARKSNGKSPIVYNIISIVSIIFVLSITAGSLLFPLTSYKTDALEQPQTHIENTLDSLNMPSNNVKRIVLTGCSIEQNKIDATYIFEGVNDDILIYQGDMYYISGENSWFTISEKMSFSCDKNSKNFTFLINESLNDGTYVCTLRYLTQKETYAIELHFQVKNAEYYGTSYNEIYSDGASNVCTNTGALYDHGL